MFTEFSPLDWRGDSLRILDQRKLPAEEVWIETPDYREVVRSIQNMAVRGAPAIGIAGAYGLALAAMELAQTANGNFSDRLHASAREIRLARPTGANLGGAVDRMLACLPSAQTIEEVVSDLVREAVRIHREDIANNLMIGNHGAKLIPWGSRALTHCNTGALATGGYGTALGIIRTAWRDGRPVELSVESSGERRLGVRVSVMARRSASREWTAPHAALVKGLALSWVTVWEPVVALIPGGEGFRIAGPVGLAEVTNVAVESRGFGVAPLIAGALSIHLGLLNLAPFPGLDGGQLVLLGLERVRGRPLPRRVEEGIGMLGLGVLMAFISIVCWIEVLRWGGS